MLIGGKVPPFPEHARYFEQEIAPRLDGERRFLGVVPLAERVDLLARARCLVVPSLVDESGPLVAMEALASGTPVVARPVGALPEILEHGRTGIFVNGVRDMARAFRDVTRLDSRECRLIACQRFSAARMAESYLALYRKLAASRDEGRSAQAATPVGTEVGSRPC
jgi:glycosyltransferase involved in cell wall biosynthesis